LKALIASSAFGDRFFTTRGFFFFCHIPMLPHFRRARHRGHRASPSQPHPHLLRHFSQDPATKPQDDAAQVAAE